MEVDPRAHNAAVEVLAEYGISYRNKEGHEYDGVAGYVDIGVLSVRMRRPARRRRWSPGPIVFSGVEQLSGGHSEGGGVSWSL